MNYQETLDYLFSRLPMFQRIGQAAYKADLNSTWALMKVLDMPHQKFKSVHIGGTNGKGSVSHLLASVLQEAGYKVGLYTSPHLRDFRERIRINGQMIPEKDVMSFVDEYRSKFEPLDLSFFEWSVGLAFHHFVREKVDIAVIEVGMGGRLDSTNVVKPLLSVITNIGMDHTQFLGDSLPRIAAEKAGIIKKNTPVVIGQTHRETEGVFRRIAINADAPIVFADQQFPMDVPGCPLKGVYQMENFQTALITIEQLREQGWNIPDDAIQKGFANVLTNTGLRGRWEIISESPLVICDVAHNKPGIEVVAGQLKAESEGKKMHLVLGFVSDKDVKGMLAMFPGEAEYYLSQPFIPRALPIEELSAAARELKISHRTFTTVKEAYEAALAKAAPDDLVFVGGSNFVVADLLSAVSKESV